MNGWKSKTGGSSLPYDIPGVAGEWAGHHVFGIKFNYHAKPTTRAELNTGDLFDQKRNIIIEIKTNRYVKPGWDLIENKEKLDKFQRNRDRPYVNCLTGLLPNYVLVIGWAWGHEIMKGRVHRHLTAGHEIYILSWKKLRPPMSLHQELGLPVPEWLKNW